MAKLSRYTQKIFGSSAGSNQLGEYGSFAAGSPARYSGSTITPAIIQTLSNYLTGWFGAVVGNNSPTIEDMNALCYLFAYQLAYVFQAGVPEWDSGTTYYIGSIVNDSVGNLYISLTNSNTGNALSSTANWQVHSNSTVQQGISSNYTILPTDSFVLAFGNITLTMPDATTVTGLQYDIINTNASVGNVIAITTTGGQTIGSIAPPYDLTQPQQFVGLRSDGSNWYIVAAG
jgi:hypothetical protein